MNKNIVDRVLREARYIIKTNSTVREIASFYDISKSTVHKDLQERLLQIDKPLHEQISKIFQQHINIRHINGGEATRRKYAQL